MGTRLAPLVVLAAAPGSLLGTERALRWRGFRVIRVATLAFEARSAAEIREAIRGSKRPDILVVTSRAAVPILPPSLRAVVRRARSVLSVGADTAHLLRRSGFRRVQAPLEAGTPGLLRVLPSVVGRTVWYIRSDRAGAGLARALRQRGARVLDLVVYRVRLPPPLSAQRKRELARASAVVVSSPSSARNLCRLLGPKLVEEWHPRVPCFAIGPKTARAARLLGFSGVRWSREATEEGFTKLLLHALEDGPDISFGDRSAP